MGRTVGIPLVASCYATPPDGLPSRGQKHTSFGKKNLFAKTIFRQELSFETNKILIEVGNILQRDCLIRGMYFVRHDLSLLVASNSTINLALI